VRRTLPLMPTVLHHLKTIRGHALVSRRRIIPTLAFTTRHYDKFSRHPDSSNFPRNIDSAKKAIPAGSPFRQNYSRILTTVPAPTVRPPSRMANRIFSSMATGWINFTIMFTLSPGITISVPSGKVTSPVTSVVRT